MNASYITTIRFQTLQIPVKMMKVNCDNSIELNQLCKDSKERVRYHKYCPSCKKEITNEDIVKGYQYAKDKYVVLEQTEIDSITTEQDKQLTVSYFCKSKEIGDLLIYKSYYLVPDMESEARYDLFRKALIANKVIAITEIVLGNQQRLIALFPNKRCIVATILFYENEINALPLIVPHKHHRHELETLQTLISTYTHEFDWSTHYDKYQTKLRNLIQKKIKQ